MIVRVTTAALLLAIAFLASPSSSFAAQDIDYNDGARRSATPAQPRPDVDSFDGSFSYEYPLTLPPGRNGIEPNLSLSYSSKNTEQISPFGYGWSLNIPYIERANEHGTNNLYSTTTNLFSSLDGELRSTTTATTTEFAALNDNGDFRKYEFLNNQGYWRVTDKSGTQYIFGTTSSSQLVDNASSTRVSRWMLEKVQDRNGNYVKYEYQKSDGQIYPYKIKYTGNGSTDGIYEVEFLRETRSDIATSSRPGFEIVSKERVKEIAVRENSNFLKSYKLGYGTGDNGQKSLLTTLLEAGRSEGGATSTMPTTTLGYSIPTEGWTQNTSWIMPTSFVDDTGTTPPEGDMGARFDDFNGDGLVDIIQSKDTDGQPEYIYFNKGDGSWSTSTNPSGIKWMANWLAEGVNSRAADIDGDGLADFVNGWASSTMNTSRGTAFTPDTSWDADISFVATTSGIFYDSGGRVVDLNGDGLVDLVKSYASSTESAAEAANGIYLNNGAGWDATSTNAWTLPSGESFAQFFGTQLGINSGANFADFNGDGLVDILYSREDGSAPYTFIYFNKGDGTWTQSTTTIDGSTSVGFFPDHGGDHYGYRIADVNSDGLPDIVHTKGSSGYTVFKNKDGGRTFERDSSWGTLPARFVCVVGGPETCGLSDDLGGRFVDINGDGIVDVVRSDGAVRHGTYNETYLGNATSSADLLVTIQSSAGGITKVGYKAVATYTDASGNELNKNLPMNFQTVQTITKNDAFGTVGTTTYEYGGGEYYYANEFDRKFAGFATTSVTDAFGNVTKTFSHQGNGTQTAIGEASDNRSLIGKPYRVESYSGTSTLYKKTFTKWENVTLSNGRKFVLKTQDLEMLYDGDSDHKDKASAYDYDENNGNLFIVTDYGEVSGSDDGTFIVTLPGTNDYSLDIENSSGQHAYISDASQTNLDITGDISINVWLKTETVRPNLPYDSAMLIRKWDGGNQYIFKYQEDNGQSDNDYALDANDGVDSEEALIDGPGDLDTNWHMLTVSKSGTTASVYIDGSLIGTGTTNAAQQNAGGEFDIGADSGGLAGIDGLIDEVGIWSRALSGSDVSALYNSGNGLLYENMSSAMKTSLQGYWPFNNSYADSSGNGNTLTGYGSPTFSTTVPFSVTVGTGFHHQTIYTYAASTTDSHVSFVKSETVLDEDSATTSERRLYYDSQALGSVTTGNLTKDERLATSTSYTNTQYAYNSYGLVTTETDPRGKQTTYSYNNNLFIGTSTNAAGHVTETYRDLSSGKIKKRVDSNGFSWETTYDGLDRPTEEKIPDHLGTPSSTVTAKTYTYTDTQGARSVLETGNLSSATSSLRYTYFDGFERKIQERTEGESSYMIKDWEYDARGQLKRESLPYFNPGTARTSFTGDQDLIVTYGYDALGRLATTTNIKGTATTTYDQWTEEVTDRNGEVKRYVYNAFKNLTAVGELTATTTATTTYAYDALNNLATTTDAYGNLRVFVYDRLSRLIKADDLHASNDTNFGVRFYGYDASGNIASTTDPNSQSVEFTYDDINRVLTENYTGAAGTELQYKYDVCINGKARLCSATTTEAVMNLEYDALGNIATSTKIINNSTTTMTFAYDRAKNVTSQLYPNGIRATYQYNDAGLLEQLWLQNSTTSVLTVVASSTDYAPTGQVSSRTLGNGLTTANVYDADALYRLTNILTSTGISTSTSAGMAADLVSYWPLDNNANDSDPSANNLTAVNSPTYTTSSKVGSHAADLESSSSQYFSISDASQNGLDFTGDLSASFWLKPESNPNSGETYFIISKVGDVYISDIAYTIAIFNDAGTIAIRFQSHDGTTHTVGAKNVTGYTAGTWYHFAVVYDAAAGEVTFYENGSSLGTDTAPGTSIANTAAPFRIGTIVSGSSQPYYDGVIDEVAVWNRKLSASEVTSLYNGGSGISYGDLGTTTTTTSGPQIQSLAYTHDNVGNILTLTDNSTGGTGHTVTFTYDDYHRLLSASTTAASSTPFRQQYAYDALGNITGFLSTTSIGTSTYAYSTTTFANPHAATTIGGTAYTYDNNGNLTAIGSGLYATAYTWDWRDRLTQTATGTATTTYAYDHDNMRIRRTVKTGSTATTTYPNVWYNYNSAGTTTAHILLPDGTPIATVEANGTATTTYWNLLDHLGGIHSVTNASGTPIETVDYLPFGDQRIASSSSTYSEQRKFTGHEFDPDSDLTYMRARYMDQDTGRFYSQDPVVVNLVRDGRIHQVLNDPQLLNAYSYARNNPALFIDRNGKFVDVPWVSNNQSVQDFATDAYQQNGGWRFALDHPHVTTGLVMAFSYPALSSGGSAISAFKMAGFPGVGTTFAMQQTFAGLVYSALMVGDTLSIPGVVNQFGQFNTNRPSSILPAVWSLITGPVASGVGGYMGGFADVYQLASMLDQTLGKAAMNLYSNSIPTRVETAQSFNTATGSSGSGGGMPSDNSLWVTPSGAVVTWGGHLVSPPPSK